MYQAGQCCVLASTAVQLKCCSLLLEAEDLSPGRSHTSEHSRAASSAPLGFISVTITTDILSCPHASCLVKLELLSPHPCSHFKMGSAAPTRFFRQIFISFTKPPLHERRQSVVKMVGIAVEMKSAEGHLQRRELDWKSTRWKTLQKDEFTLLNLCKELKSLMSFNSCYHFQDINSLCHKHYLFTHHPCRCAPFLDTEGWMKNNSHCLRKSLTCHTRAFRSSVQCSQQWDGSMVQ